MLVSLVEHKKVENIFRRLEAMKAAISTLQEREDQDGKLPDEDPDEDLVDL